jgi:hypothetical protein
VEREVRQASARCAERLALWFAVVRGCADYGPVGEPGRSERCSSMNERMLHAPARAHGAHTTGGEQERQGGQAGIYDAGGRGTKGVRASGPDEQQGWEYYWAW